ncbi:hypothetical protein Barb6_01061 [Bacteroidales bacterium Barb6]|nr:hypothetical protein Barb6_01061 [Bacteroidales bacterium Barb6]
MKEEKEQHGELREKTVNAGLLNVIYMLEKAYMRFKSLGLEVSESEMDRIDEGFGLARYEILILLGNDITREMQKLVEKETSIDK